jgi:hypothetical protein
LHSLHKLGLKTKQAEQFVCRDGLDMHLFLHQPERAEKADGWVAAHDDTLNKQTLSTNKQKSTGGKQGTAEAAQA